MVLVSFTHDLQIENYCMSLENFITSLQKEHDVLVTSLRYSISVFQLSQLSETFATSCVFIEPVKNKQLCGLGESELDWQLCILI